MSSRIRPEAPTPRQRLIALGSPLHGLINIDAPVGTAAAQIVEKLAASAKLITMLELVVDKDDFGFAPGKPQNSTIVFTCAPENKAKFIAALREVGVTQSESTVPGTPGRMWFGQGANRSQVRVATDEKVDPRKFLAGG